MEKFVLGCIVGMSTVIVLIMLISPYVITSHKKLTPEWCLETNGKTIDTIYIYKNEK